jgi:hypothetical protein
VNDEVVFGKPVQSVSPCAIQINSINFRYIFTYGMKKKLTVARFCGDTIEYPIYVESDDSITETEALQNYHVTVSMRRNIRKYGQNVDLGPISGDVHANKSNASRPDSVAESVDSSKGSTSILSDDDPMPPTKRRRLDNRRRKLQSTPTGHTSAHYSHSMSQLHNIPLRYDCDICLENLDLTSCCNRRLEISCGHLKRVCISCVQNWISSTLEENGPDNICCPLCPQELTYDNISSLATKDTFTRYYTRFPFLR